MAREAGGCRRCSSSRQRETSRTRHENDPVVLLAEDNDDTRRVYGLILRHFGYQVDEATNGEDAVDWRAPDIRISS